MDPVSNLRIVNYRADRGPRVGMLDDEGVSDVAELTGRPEYASIGNFMRDWDAAVEQVRRSRDAGARTGTLSREEVQLLAPVRHGAAIYGAGANYYGHSREMAEIAGRPAPADPRLQGQKPWHFLKAPSTVVGEGAIVERPEAAAETLDWEVELAVVIRGRAKRVSPEDALDYVAGYTVANDLSARGLLWREGLHERSPFRADWVLHKNFDGSTPLGPWLVPAREIPDPQSLGLGLRVNGETMQADRTSDMIFTVAEQIAHLSNHITLTPGDIILTGTPGGNAAVHGRFLHAGDVVEAWVERIGTLTTRIA
jgi:2-keto-4-pentenoate hydratase/2-oxohepta-3-ene-1,7-dioic acid hydratase in catechol pathway